LNDPVFREFWNFCVLHFTNCTRDVR
jgi:hypothetical protein